METKNETLLTALFGDFNAPLTEAEQTRKAKFDTELAKAEAEVIVRRGSLDCRDWE